MTHRPVLARILGGAVQASFATFAALIGHLAGGGALPALRGILTPLLFSLLLCTLLTGRRISAARLGAAVLGSQLLFHALFMLGTPGGMHALHDHAAADSAIGAALAELLPTATVMQLSHLVAAIFTAAFVYYGEIITLRLSRLAARFSAWLRYRLGLHPLSSSALPGGVRLPVASDYRHVLNPAELAAIPVRGPPLRRGIATA